MIARMDEKVREARIAAGFPPGEQLTSATGNLTVASSTGRILNDLSSQLQEKRLERQRLDAAIQELSTTINALARVYGVVPPTTTDQLNPTTFVGMSVPDAIKTYLRLVGEPQYLSQITKGLIAGGIAHNSSDFQNTVYMALRRGRDADEADFKRFEPKKWGLASWEDQLLKGGSFKAKPQRIVGKVPR